jgi:lipid-A-disaccharide synthase
MYRDRPYSRPSSHTGQPAIFFSTGSTSADLLLKPVLRELQERGSIGLATGVGGTSLRELDVELLHDTTSSAAVGVVASLTSLAQHAGQALSTFRQIDRYFRRVRPALALLVDNSGINLRILRKARRHGIPTCYFVPPEFWSLWWFEVQPLLEQSTWLVPIFQSEARVLAERGGHVRWVGHPLVDLLPVRSRPADAHADAPTIGLFPGSRQQEVQQLLGILRDAAAIIARTLPRARFVLCAANELAYRQVVGARSESTVPMEIVQGQSHAVLARCDLLLTCSGTATLEAALLGVPMVAMYRVDNPLDRILTYYKLYRGGYPMIALPNSVLGRRLVPELTNADITPERVASEGLALLCDRDRRATMLAGLAEVRARLGAPGTIGRLADLVEEFLDQSRGKEPTHEGVRHCQSLRR